MGLVPFKPAATGRSEPTTLKLKIVDTTRHVNQFAKAQALSKPGYSLFALYARKQRRTLLATPYKRRPDRAQYRICICERSRFVLSNKARGVYQHYYRTLDIFRDSCRIKSDNETILSSSFTHHHLSGAQRRFTPSAECVHSSCIIYAQIRL